MRRLVLVLSACVLLGACSSESAVQDAVRNSLKDPESARFGEFTADEVDGKEFACLTVNARNTYGGYTGDQQASLIKDDEGNWSVLNIAEMDHDSCLEMVGGLVSGETAEEMDAIDAALENAGAGS